MSYGASIRDAYRQAGIYAARILKGEKVNLTHYGYAAKRHIADDMGRHDRVRRTA